MRKRTSALIGGVVCIIGFVGSTSSAALIAADNAANPAYSGGWANGSNGGSGFSPWAIAGTTGSGSPSFHGYFLGNSGTNGSNGGPSIGTSAFGLYSNSQNIQNAVRPFAADSTGATALTARQTISFRIDNGFINSVAPAGSVGFGLQTAGGTNRLELFFTGGDSFYRLSDNAGTIGTGLGFTDGGLNVAVTINTASTYTAVITRLADNSSFTRNGTFTGTPAAFDVAQVRFFSFNAGSGNANNAFVNNLAISKPVISITAGVPTAYGTLLGTATVTGGSGSYQLAQVLSLTGNRGYIALSGFNPVTDAELIALQVLVNGVPASGAQLAQLAAAIGASASVTSPSASFPGSYNLFLSFSGGALPGGAQPYYFGYDFSTAAQSLGNVTIAAVAVVPEPTTLAALTPAAPLLLLRRRR